MLIRLTLLSLLLFGFLSVLRLLVLLFLLLFGLLLVCLSLLLLGLLPAPGLLVLLFGCCLLYTSPSPRDS
mgnify:CR=1 FL=1